MDRVAEPLRSGAIRRRSTRARARARRRNAVLSVPAVDRRHAVAAARAQPHAHGVELFGDLPFMVDGDSADVWAQQQQFRLDASVGVPPDAFSATGQDWGMPVYRWDAIGGRRLPLAARARAPQRRPLRRLPRRSPRRLLSHLRPAARRRRAVLHAGRRAGADWRSASGCSIFRGAGRRDHRRGSRHRARLRARVAGAARRARLPRLPLGARTGTRRSSRSATRRDYPRVSVATSGTHDTEPMAVWWDEAPDEERQTGRAICRPFGSSPRGADLVDAPLQRRWSATCCSRRCSPPARTCCCCRFRMCSAGAIASTSRRRSPTTTGRSGCRGRSIDSTRFAEARERRDRLRAWSEKHGR